MASEMDWDYAIETVLEFVPVGRREALVTWMRHAAGLQAQIATNDQIYDMYKRLIQAIPECVAHGECVPHAVEWIEQAKAREERFKAQVATLHAENARLQEENETLTAQNIALTEDAALCIESSSFHEAALSIKSLHEQVATLHQENADYAADLKAAYARVDELETAESRLTRERAEARAELAACSCALKFLVSVSKSRWHQLDECRGEQMEMKEWGQQLVVAERQLAESIGKRLQLEDQIAAVRTYCETLVNLTRSWANEAISNDILALLPASPPEPARAAEAIMFSVAPLFPDEDCEEPPTGEDLYLKARGLSLLVTAERGSQGAYCLLVDGTVHKSGTFGLEPLPASPTPTKEPR